MEFILQLVLIVVLILLNGFFVASEFALVAVRKTRIDELAKKRNGGAILVQKALNDLDNYISATQLGITIASIALGWVGEPALAHFFEPFFHFFPDNITIITSHTIAVILSFALITFLHIVIGELAPKTVALQVAEPVALFVMRPLMLFAIIFKPAIYVLNVAGRIVVRAFGFQEKTDRESVLSEEEIKIILNQSGNRGIIPKDEVEMVYNVFRLGEIPVKHIMIPRTDIIAFKSTNSLKEVSDNIGVEHIHSRFPIYEKSIDTIIGFIHIKDVYKALQKKENLDKNVLQANIIREIISVPESKKADDVLVEMRKKWIHMAVVNDEYGGTAGIVTLEDVIESLVGEIQDEFDKPLNEMQRKSDGSFLVDGGISIEQVQRKFHIPLRGQGYTTIAGLLFSILGREPKIGDKVEIGDVSFEIENIARKRIRSIRVRKIKKKK